MPQWGLTEKQRLAEPWDIDPKWLTPGKVIRDPIQGDIYVTRLEQAIIDSSPFQRLRRIRQLGMVHLVYPGATHTRFIHALGALRVVQNLLDIVIHQGEGLRPRMDLFQQWRDEDARALAEEGNEDWRRPNWKRKKTFQEISLYDWRVAEVTVLARLGALIHDLGHVAYGHSIEDDLHILAAHDRNRPRLEEFWKSLSDGCTKEEDRKQVEEILNRHGLKQALQAITLDKEHRLKGKEDLGTAEEQLRRWDKYPFVADLVGNTICADLLDYLPRDHTFSGLPVALGDRFMNAFYVVPRSAAVDGGHYPERMALAITTGGRERKDIFSEVRKYLSYRYEEQERIIVHHAKVAADAMLGKALELWTEGEWMAAARVRGGAEVANVLGRKGPRKSDVRDALLEDLEDGEAVAGDIEEQVLEATELRLRAVGDDGLLEYLSGRARGAVTEGERKEADQIRASLEELEQTEALRFFDELGCLGDGGPGGPNAPLVRQLSADLLDRRLYKRAAQATGKAARRRVHDLFGDRVQRRSLEQQAADYAGVPDEHVAIWLPDPDMRLKIAEVLVDFDTGIAPLHEYSKTIDQIYEDHKALWTVTVFVHESVRREGKQAIVLARLAELMELEWDRERPRKAKRPSDWPVHLAATRLLSDDALDQALDELLRSETVGAQRSFDSYKTFEALEEKLAPEAKRVRKKYMPDEDS